MLENLLLLFTGIIGLITVTTIAINFASNRISNIYLILLLLLTSIRYFINGFDLIDGNSFVNKLLDNFQNLQMLTYPLLYLYFKNLIFNTKNIKLNESKHFIFLIILRIINQKIIDSPISESVTIYYIYFLFFLSYTFFYLILIYRLLNKEIWNRVGILAIVTDQNKLLKKWSVFLFLTVLFISVRNLLLIFFNLLNYPILEKYSWFSVVLFLMLLIKILTTPEILHGYTFLLKKINNEKCSNVPIKSFWSIKTHQDIVNVRDLELKEIINDTIILNNIKKIDSSSYSECFRVPGFSISDFAKELNIPKSHLNYLFKYHSKISFTDFKKITRIQYSLRLIDSNFLVNNTLDELSKKAGFVSYNTFFVSFKDITGVNPIEYSKINETFNVL